MEARRRNRRLAYNFADSGRQAGAVRLCRASVSRLGGSADAGLVRLAGDLEAVGCGKLFEHRPVWLQQRGKPTTSAELLSFLPINCAPLRVGVPQLPPERGVGFDAGVGRGGAVAAAPGRTRLFGRYRRARRL